MRGARCLIVLAAASLVGACAREAPSYAMIEPQSGRLVSMVQQPSRPTPVNVSSPGSRGLFGGSSQPTSAQAQAYYPPQVMQVPPSSPGYPAPAYGAPVAAGGRGAYAQAYQPGYTAPPSRPQAYQAYASAPAAYPETYALDTGDKLRIIVFGQDGLSSSYMVDAGGNVTMPLIGSVPARGMSAANLADSITSRLKQGYVREPKVTVEVEAYRPFFILGEVTTPGQYPYTPNMTAETAIAIAGGFAPRASKSTVKVTRNLPSQQFSGDVPLNFALKPGDTVLVKERWF